MIDINSVKQVANSKTFAPFPHPQRIDVITGLLERMELHHNHPQREGGLFDVEAMWPDEHALIDDYRRIGKK